MKKTLRSFSLTKIRQLHERYETHFSALALTSGLAVDSLTLRRIDLWAENAVILGFLVTAGLAILLMHLYNTGWLKKVSFFGYEPFAHADWWLPLVMQFAFGGLFSVFLVFYGRSGAIAANWPFFLILIGLLVGNEIARRHYQKIYFNTIVWYTAVFAYTIFAVPLVVGHIGPVIFVISGMVSLAVIAAFVRLLKQISPEQIKASNIWIVSVGSIFVRMNMLYFLNVLPPIPLSLEHTQIAHHVQRMPDSTYQVIHEKEPWYQPVVGSPTIHLSPEKPVFFFSSVFAPTDLTTNVVHRWQYKKLEKWVTASEISFPVIGGRVGGYRGYSQKQNVFPGRWRVITATDDGRVLGQTTFTISFDGGTLPLTTSTY